MKNHNKVFVIGFHKTGTTSLENALQRLGYKVYGGDKNLLKFEKQDDLSSYIQKTLVNWDAVQDMPWPLFYKDLYKLYPEAKFILSIRDTEEWIDSVIRHWGSMRIPLHQKIYDVPCAEGYEDTYKAMYGKHNREVVKFFKEKKNFLIMEQGKNFDYRTLCNFLGINVIDEEFPHSRKNDRIRAKIKLYRWLRSLYWNYRNDWN